jgi:hypothetical protein
MTAPSREQLEMLQGLAERALSANPGPWAATLKEGNVPIVAGSKHAVAIAAAPGDAGRQAARYIALACNVVPELVARIIQLEGEAGV